MKSSKAEVQAKVYRIPTLRFEDEQRLTSYSGLVIFLALFQRLHLKDRLRRCFAHLVVQPIFSIHTIVLLLVVHLLLGFRRLRGLDYYRHDPLVARVLGLRKLPDVSTVSRAMAHVDARAVEEVRDLMREMVGERLVHEKLPRVTLDFDGSVQSTKGHAEGTAVGYNKVKKGARSYYPLFCTIAQTGQFWDMHHRSGNVHDSNGAALFMLECLYRVKAKLPMAKLESRIDCAFFDQRILGLLDGFSVGFTCSVPFERFPELKRMIETRMRWERIDDTWSFFEGDWKPKSWNCDFRFLFLRQKKPQKRMGPLQLDLFEPRDFDYEYKVLVTGMSGSAKSVLLFHNGRGSQEKLFGEAKQHAALDLVATKRLHANQLFTLSGMLAHNLTRELQMQADPRTGRNAPKRSPLWDFLQLGTLRQHLLHLAGRLTRPQGELTLTLNNNAAVRDELLHYMRALEAA